MTQSSPAAGRGVKGVGAPLEGSLLNTSLKLDQNESLKVKSKSSTESPKCRKKPMKVLGFLIYLGEKAGTQKGADGHWHAR